MSVTILRADAAHLPLPDASVDLCVTSPPYFGLRSYVDNGEHMTGQVGDEATPAEYLDALVACTAEWMRVLKPAGSIFVNLGDKYASYEGNRGRGQVQDNGPRPILPTGSGLTGGGFVRSKSLFGLPWRYALRCIDDLGLILRAEIVWSKPNGLPESVSDRVRRSHEQVFHMVKQPRYFSAVDEVREELAPKSLTHRGGGLAYGEGANHYTPEDAEAHRNGWGSGPAKVRRPDLRGKLPGSVWTIPTAPLTVPDHLGVDHFAAYPPELVRRIVLGWSPREVCTACGEGRRPVAEAAPFRPRAFAAEQQDGGRNWHGGDPATRSLGVPAAERQRSITGYACACPDTTAPATPGVCLDPFGGTGTTALVASTYGRHGISVDLSADYCRLAKWRTSDPGERARVLGVPKPEPVPEAQMDLFGEWSA